MKTANKLIKTQWERLCVEMTPLSNNKLLTKEELSLSEQLSLGQQQFIPGFKIALGADFGI